MNEVSRVSAANTNDANTNILQEIYYSPKGFVGAKKLKDIIKRDKSDEHRKIAPLKQAKDAFLIDTSHLSKNVVINMILSKIQS